jgi:uracil-DNA glycosylase
LNLSEIFDYFVFQLKSASAMDVKIEESWKKQLQEEFEKPYFKQLSEFVRSEYASQTIYPPAKLIFNAFNQCPFDQVKVVILGQDPYHGPGQAHGLCFSVNDGIDFPPSLRNIFKEIQADTGVPIPSSGNLERWAQQGVLLLNATLTVRAHLAGSHQKKGWEQFTDSVIHLVANKLDHVVFILWGNYAISKGEFIDQQKHLVLKSVHPSPLSASRGFFGNKQFSRANNYLTENGKKQIQW